MVKINKEEYELLKSSVFYWKWIAREEDGKLYKFHGKPKKIKGSRWTDRKQTWLGMSSDRFQFIQWEDEEPYNTQELIEEYEGEIKVQGTDVLFKSLDEPQSPPIPDVKNEKTEIKKNIEWLKEEMDSMHRMRDLDRNPDEWFISKTALLKAIDQLDEPEVLSQKITLEQAYEKIAESFPETIKEIETILEKYYS